MKSKLQLVSRALVGALCLSALAGATASADDKADATAEIDPLDIPPENDPLAHAWSNPNKRNGFYARLTTAIGVHDTRIGPAPWEADGARAHGFGSGFGLDAGYMLAPWVALHLDSTLGVLWNGEIRHENGYRLSPNDNARVLAYGFAPATTFFVPGDVFLKTGFGVGLATLRTRGGSDTSDPGFYMDLAVGKDFAVSRNAAIGISFQVLYHLLGNDAAHDDLRVRQFLFGLSAAFDSI